VAAACHVLEPAGGECDDQLLVAVVGFVTLRRTTTILALLKAVECQDGLGSRSDRRRAVVLWVSLTVLTAVWVITLLAVAGLAWEVATCWFLTATSICTNMPLVSSSKLIRY
jgi:hypothetical protein